MKYDELLQIRIPSELKTWLKRAAKKKGKGVRPSEVARAILTEAFDQRHAK